MVDYSKWDKMAAELSDEDEGPQQVAPQVSVFDSPGGESIRIGPDGPSVVSKAQTQMQANNITTAIKGEEDTARKTSSSAGLVAGRSERKSVVDLATEQSLNGAICSNYSWRQDRHEVVLLVDIPVQTKGKDLVADIDQDKILDISTKYSGQNTTILRNQLRYPVEMGDSYSLEWEIKPYARSTGFDSSLGVNESISSCLELTLRKKSPIPGATIWWENVFVCEPAIDVTKIKGRQISNSLHDNWAEAQKQFLQKVGNREKISVDH